MAHLADACLVQLAWIKDDLREKRFAALFKFRDRSLSSSPIHSVFNAQEENTFNRELIEPFKALLLVAP